MRTSKKYSNLTAEEHEQLGRELVKMREELGAMAVKLGNTYPLRTKVYKHAMQAQRSLDQLRSILDDLVYREHGDELKVAGKDPFQVYYPKPGAPIASDKP